MFSNLYKNIEKYLLKYNINFGYFIFWLAFITTIFPQYFKEIIKSINKLLFDDFRNLASLLTDLYFKSVLLLFGIGIIFLILDSIDEKIKKKDDDMSIALERTDDILKYLGEHKPDGQFLCGFSMETENMIGNSRVKLTRKNLDMVAANNVKMAGAGFQGDTNVLTLITQDEEVSLPLMSKEDAAGKILDKILLERVRR